MAFIHRHELDDYQRQDIGLLHRMGDLQFYQTKIATLRDVRRPKYGHDPLFQPLRALRGLVPQSTPLELLPGEVFDMIWSLLDVRSVVKLNQTSRSLRNRIGNVPQLRRLGTHAKCVIWELFHIDVAGSISVASLYTALITNKCSGCDDIGPMINKLPPVQRFCKMCVVAQEGPWLLADLARHLEVNKTEITRRVRVWRIPKGDGVRPRLLVSREDALSLCKALGKPEPIYASCLDYKALKTFLPFLHLETDTCCFGIRCPGCRDS